MVCYEYEGKLSEIVASENDYIFRIFVDKSLVFEGEKDKYYTVCKTYSDKSKNQTSKPETVEIKKNNDTYYYLELQCEKNLFNGYVILTSLKLDLKIRVLFEIKKNTNQGNETSQNNGTKSNAKDENKYVIKEITVCF